MDVSLEAHAWMVSLPTMAKGSSGGESGHTTTGQSHIYTTIGAASPITLLHFMFFFFYLRTLAAASCLVLHSMILWLLHLVPFYVVCSYYVLAQTASN